MRASLTFLVAFLLAGTTSYGGLYTFNSSPNGTIPDGNPTGFQDTITVSGLSSLDSVTVYLNVSGGYNGDLYAYLTYRGTSVVLLDRIGHSSETPFGSSTAGFGGGSTWNNGTSYSYSFRLDDTGSTGLHNVSGDSGAVTGSYRPDGSSLLSSFNSVNGGNPNGDWTIFFSDMAGGGGAGTSTLVSWGLGIEAAPEPVNVALGIFGGIFLVAAAVRSRPVRNRMRCWKAAFVQWVDAV